MNNLFFFLHLLFMNIDRFFSIALVIVFVAFRTLVLQKKSIIMPRTLKYSRKKKIYISASMHIKKTNYSGWIGESDTLLIELEFHSCSGPLADRQGTEKLNYGRVERASLLEWFRELNHFRLIELQARSSYRKNWNDSKITILMHISRLIDDRWLSRYTDR